MSAENRRANQRRTAPLNSRWFHRVYPKIPCFTRLSRALRMDGGDGISMSDMVKGSRSGTPEPVFHVIPLGAVGSPAVDNPVEIMLHGPMSFAAARSVFPVGSSGGRPAAPPPP